MSRQITVTLPDPVYEQAEHLAHLTGQNVASILEETIATSLSPLGLDPKISESMSELSDQVVLALADLQMGESQDQRLSNLLDRQQTGSLTEAERVELAALMQVYQQGLLQKARALREAVHRGLRDCSDGPPRMGCSWMASAPR